MTRERPESGLQSEEERRAAGLWQTAQAEFFQIEHHRQAREMAFAPPPEEGARGAAFDAPAGPEPDAWQTIRKLRELAALLRHDVTLTARIGVELKEVEGLIEELSRGLEPPGAD